MIDTDNHYHSERRQGNMFHAVSRNIFLAAAAAVIAAASAGPLQAGSASDKEGKQIQASLESFPLKHGAQLYDNWPKLTGRKPEGSHPLYPDAGKKQGGSSWRCKECHGWDYVGRDGRYAEGSHYTGIRGVLEIAGRPSSELYGALTNSGDGHDFSTYLSETELKALSAFLGEGLVDIRPHIGADGKASGDAGPGKKLYRSHCAECHGEDGNKLDFKARKEGVQGVGWLADDNPQESLHKILWGHPGSDMPSLVVDGGLTVKEAADILSYTQTMP
jgi:thiosulfate dehydrogenase